MHGHFLAGLNKRMPVRYGSVFLESGVVGEGEGIRDFV